MTPRRASSRCGCGSRARPSTGGSACSRQLSAGGASGCASGHCCLPPTALYRVYIGIADGTPIPAQWTCRRRCRYRAGSPLPLWLEDDRAPWARRTPRLCAWRHCTRTHARTHARVCPRAHVASNGALCCVGGAGRCVHAHQAPDFLSVRWACASALNSKRAGGRAGGLSTRHSRRP